MRSRSVRRKGCRAGAVVALIAALAPAGAAAAGPDPFGGARLYADPSNHFADQARAWRASRPDDAALMRRFAGTPIARWAVGGRTRVDAGVRAYVRRARAARRVPVVVAYNIPHRDCGQHSAGGTAARDYRRWVRSLARVLGRRRSAVVLEPDALAGIDCLTPELRSERLALLRDAVGVLGRRGVGVYLDAGHSGWQPAGRMVSRLRAAGVGRARGFALNVSNFRWTRTEVRYGERIARRLGRGAHFVVDTSRNGRGPAAGDEWCNPPGRALGRRPTTRTGRGRVDALLWIKVPGESDGTCNGGPPAGSWWPEYALGLARRAVRTALTP